MRVVFDTNVYISALVVQGSLSDQAYRYAREGWIDLFTSVAILTELARKLREKFGWQEDRIRAALKSVSRTVRVVKTTPHLSICSDATDNQILECAEEVGADLIVTGDPHLLKLGRLEHAGLVTVSTFLQIIGRRSSKERGRHHT